jgi:hypothetical protein
MELNLQSLFGLPVLLIGWDPATSPLPRIRAHIRGRYWSATIDDISLWPPPWPKATEGRGESEGGNIAGWEDSVTGWIPTMVRPLPWLRMVLLFYLYVFCNLGGRGGGSLTDTKYIYLEDHSVCPLVETGTSPSPLPQANVPPPPPPEPKERAHSPAGKGLGSLFWRLAKKPTLPTLCFLIYSCSYLEILVKRNGINSTNLNIYRDSSSSS